MPICHTRKFIFYHIPRCAGTAVEEHFNINIYQACHGVIQRGKQVITLHHLTPGDMLTAGFIDSEAFYSYFKFTIIREPFARMVSDFFWQKQHKLNHEFHSLTFPGYLDKAEQIIRESRYHEKKHYDHFRPMIEYCFSDGELMLDDILILENLDKELRRVRKILGDVKLPRVNSSVNANHGLDTLENRERVYDIYAADKQFYDRLLTT